MNAHTNLITVTPTESDSGALVVSIDQIRQQVALVQTLLREVMVQDVHYGLIPGCGDSPALLQPGAQKICMMFRLAVSDIAIEERDAGNGHREYKVIVTLTNTKGAIIARGVGVCSTMEKKYRYRNENTRREVPQAYWQTRDSELLGGPSFVAQKRDKKWVIVQQVENPDPADYYNTACKMAKKRAHIDATITATACGDIFDRKDAPPMGDVDPETGEYTPRPTASAAPARKPYSAPPRPSNTPPPNSNYASAPLPTDAAPPTANPNGTISEGQLRVITQQCFASGMEEVDLCNELGISGGLKFLPAARINEAIEICKNYATKE